jgi:hypothetical protein
MERLKTYFEREIDSLILGLEKELKTCFDYPQKFQITDDNFDVEKMTWQEIRNYQIKNSIQILQVNKTNNGHKFYRWNKEYLKEALSNSYILVLNDVRLRLRNLKTNALRKINTNGNVVKYFEKELERYEGYLSNPEFQIYFDKEYRNKHYGMLKDRFDAIWFINEKNTSNNNDILPNDINFARDLEYPFVIINAAEWMEYEAAYQIIPLLNSFLNFITNPSQENKKILTPLEQVIFIEIARTKIENFNSLGHKEKLHYLNLITNGNNKDLGTQLNALELILDMDADVYSNLEENHSEWGRLLKDVSNTNLSNLRGAVSEYTRKFIKKENDKNNSLLSPKDIEYNQKTYKIKEKINRKQLQIEDLF